MVLNEFPFPLTVTIVQLTSIACYSGPFFNLWGVRKYVDIPCRYYFKYIVPLALGKFFASVSSHISIWRVPVSYAHTVKATMPFFTVILSRVIMKEKQTMTMYCSLIPIITGVAIATLTELSFDIVGLISALISTMGVSLQNILSKKVLKDTGIHHLRLLHLLGKLALFMFMPIWLYIDCFNVFKHPAITTGDYKVTALLFADGVLNWLQNIIAFSVLSLVTPLTYAVASASKRIFVIAVSLFILGNPVTWLNILGMLLASLGVLCYNRAKQLSRSQTVLPFTNESWNKYTPMPTTDDLYRNGKPATNGALNGYKANNLLSNNNVHSASKMSMVPMYPTPLMHPSQMHPSQMHPQQMLYPPMPPGVILPHPYPIPMRYSPEVEEKLERIRVARSREKRSERERRKSESDMEQRKALTYTGLDRAIAESFLEQQERTNGSNIDCTSLNQRGRCEDVVM